MELNDLNKTRDDHGCWEDRNTNPVFCAVPKVCASRQREKVQILRVSRSLRSSSKVKRHGHPEKMLQHKVALAQSRHRMAQPLGAIKGFKIVADEDLRRRHDLLEQHTFVLERKEHTLHARLAGMDAMLQQQRLESSAAAINREDLHGTLNRELLVLMNSRGRNISLLQARV